MSRTVLAILAVFAVARPAAATLVLFNGSWSTTLDNQGFDGATSSGAASFLFDTSLVNPALPSQEFDLLTLSTLSISPNPFGSTAMSTANVSAWLMYESGSLESLVIGAGASPTIVSGTLDDFSVRFNGPLTETTPGRFNLINYS